ncbi:MAG: GNAT family N-acetyltransferase [Candidatus Eremiobacteraeota bacterium]|nr:GNAT family N-acetyltransferase [Candidatus Eremiobacteraeota bacterium]
MIAAAIHPHPARPARHPNYRLRPFTEGDVPRYCALLASLSPEDVRLRFHSVTAPSDPEQIRGALLGAGSLGAVLVETCAGELVGVAHAAPANVERRGEFGILVAAAHRRRRLGGALADMLLHGMAARGVTRAEAYTAWENRAAAALLRSRGFRARHVGGGLVRWLRG